MKYTATLFLSLFVFLVLCGHSALADRYLVTYKNPTSFAALSAKMPTGVQVSERLVNLGSAIVNVDAGADLEALAHSPGVKNVEKEIFHPLPMPVNGFHLTPAWNFTLNYSLDEAHASQVREQVAGQQTPWGIKAIKAEGAWDLSKQGEGARVVILDTGIDKDHPAVKANFEQGKDFVQDGNTPYEFADKIGHGTHVAGTIAASQSSNGFTGVAPKAKILSGRVCGDEGCSNFAVVEGINWAISEKADVINMSLGGPFSTPGERDAVAAAEAAGVVVVAASGNDGTPKVGFPAALPTAFAVGAVDSSIKRASFSQYGPELAIVAPGVDVESSVPMGSGRESEVSVDSQVVPSTSFSGSAVVQVAMSKTVQFVGLGKADDFKGINLKGKFALIQRGEITFAEKVQNALAADAEGVVIFNNEPGLIQGSISEDGSVLQIPVVMIEKTIGEQAKSDLDAGKAVSVGVKVATSDYASYSGTSMATPHITGVVALVKAANPKLTPAQVRDLLKSTAEPLTGYTHNEVGAGLVNAEKAVTEAAKLR